MQGNAVNFIVSGTSSYTVTAWLPFANFANQTATWQIIVANASATYTVTASIADDCLDTA